MTEVQLRNYTENKALNRFRNDINGLRAVAVLAVLGFHFAPKVIPGGFVGVDVFFVISGYLMTEIILGRLSKGSFVLSNFYLARAQRIIPALAAVSAAVLVGGMMFLLPTELIYLGKHVASSVAFLSNIIYWLESGYFDVGSESKWLLHTWSLSVEWQFYLIYPMGLMLLAKMVPSRLYLPLLSAAAMGSLGLALYLSNTSPSTGFFMLPPRMWEMLAGGIVYLLPTPRQTHARFAQIGGIALISWSIIFAQAKAWPGVTTIVPVLGAALIISAELRNSRITGNFVMNWIGLRSYSIYLWHWPLAVILARSEYAEQPIWILGGILVALVLGDISWRFLERALQSGRSQQGGAAAPKMMSMLKAYAIPVGLAGGVAVAGTAVWVLRGLPQRFSPALAVIAKDADTVNPFRAGCFVRDKSVPKPCVVGDHTGIALVTMLGDSHADSAVSALVASLPENMVGGVAFNAYAACPPLFGARSRNPESKCEAFNSFFLGKQVKTRATPLVLVADWNGYLERPTVTFSGGDEAQYAEDFSSHLISTSCALARAGPTWLMLPTPEFAVDVVEDLQRRVIANGLASDRVLAIDDYYAGSTKAITMLKAAKDQCGVRLLDPTPYLCPNGKCMASMGGRPLYRDKHHLSEFGNKLLVPLFQKVFDPSTKAVDIEK